MARSRYRELELEESPRPLSILVVPLGTEQDNLAVLCPLTNDTDLIERLRSGDLVLHTYDGCPADIVDRVRSRLLSDIERAGMVARGRRLAAGVSAGILAALSVGTWFIPDPAGTTDEWLFPLGALIGVGAWRILEPRMRGYLLYQKELPEKLDHLDVRESSLLTALLEAIRAWEEGDMEHAVIDPALWTNQADRAHLEEVVAALADHFQLRRLPGDRQPLLSGKIPLRLERKRCAILNATGASAAALDVYRLFVAACRS